VEQMWLQVANLRDAHSTAAVGIGVALPCG